MTGQVPEPRSGYSSCVEGDRIYMFGGEGSNQLFQDFYIFDSISYEWSQVTGVDWPSARKDACLVCKFPYFGIFGGTTINGYDGDLYYVDLRYNDITLISRPDDGLTPGRLAFMKCWVYETADGDIEFMVAIGESVGKNPKGDVFTYRLSKGNWRKEGTTLARSHAAGISTRDRLLIAGGEQWGVVAYSDVFIYDIATKGTTVIGNLPGINCSGGSVYIKTSLYLQGGADDTSSKYRPSLPSSNFKRIEMMEDCDSTGCDWPCSPGTYMISKGICEFCPKGTYNPNFGAVFCTKCPVGTSSKYIGNTSYFQCYPCNEDTYNPKEGASTCLECPSGFVCSIGNATPSVARQRVEGSLSNQPLSYNGSKDISEITSAFVTSMIVLGSVVVGIFIILDPKKRWYFKKFDLFQKNHTHFIGEIMTIRARVLGGLFSVLFILIALIFILLAIIVYYEDNIQESKALVPLVTLEEEYDNVRQRQFNGDITVELAFENYGGNCETGVSQCKADITVSDEKIEGVPKKSCRLIEKICYVKWECNGCNVGTGASIRYEMQQRESYAETIVANVTSTSSIPNQISSIRQVISAEFDKVYRGSEVNHLYFEMTPSVSCNSGLHL